MRSVYNPSYPPTTSPNMYTFIVLMTMDNEFRAGTVGCMECVGNKWPECIVYIFPLPPPFTFLHFEGNEFERSACNADGRASTRSSFWPSSATLGDHKSPRWLSLLDSGDRKV